MNRFFYSTALIALLLSSIAHCQIPGKAFLMAELQDNGVEFDISEYLYKINMKAVDSYNKSPDGVIVIRVCSSDPLPIAMFFGIDNPLNNVPVFSEKYFEPSKNTFQRKKKTEVFFLRTNKNCLSYKCEFLTQWWFIPEGADFPEFVEYKRAEDISVSRLIYENYLPSNGDRFFFQINSELLETGKDVEATSENYALAGKKIAELLKKNRTAYLLIGTPPALTAFRREKKIIDPRAVALKSFLSKQGIGSYRMFIRECSRCFSEIYRSQSKDLYPEVSIIYQK